MAMQQCPNGHLYDDSKQSSCPFCGNGNSVNATIPLYDTPAVPQQPANNAFPSTVPLGMENDNIQPQNLDNFPATSPVDNEFGKTTYVDAKENEISVVRGWLVCLEGKKRGAAFEISGGRNSIGRGNTNDIKLEFDNSISKGVNAIVSYDERNNKFFIFLGESKNNIYVNNHLLMMPVELKDYDVIEIGTTKMLFRSLCNELFNWPKEENNEK